MVMSINRPTSLEEALQILADNPEMEILGGGTDFMVEVNYGHRRPVSILSLSRIAELRDFEVSGSELYLGSGITFSKLVAPPLAELVPGLAQAARTVGSPQIRNAGTIGGNLATASPAGDTLPILLALDARVEISSLNSVRSLRINEFITGPKQTVLQPQELITGIRVPLHDSSQEFLKVGTRNAMVISVATVALVIDWDSYRVGCGLGSVGPGPMEALEAESWLAAKIDWGNRRIPLEESALRSFSELVARAARPIDDHRSTAEYRRHAVAVCARRALERASHAYE